MFDQSLCLEAATATLIIHIMKALVSGPRQTSPTGLMSGVRPRRRRPHQRGGAAADDDQPRGASDRGRGPLHDRRGRPGRGRQDQLPGVLAADGGLAQPRLRAQPVQGGLETVPPPACSAEPLDTCHVSPYTWHVGTVQMF